MIASIYAPCYAIAHVSHGTCSTVSSAWPAVSPWLLSRLLQQKHTIYYNIQSPLYPSIYIHIYTYQTIYPSLYIIHPYVNNHLSRYLCTHVLMYSCTDVLLYSCTHIVNVYDTATVRRLYLRNNTSVYILYISGPANNLKISNTPTECPHPHLGIV